MRLAVLRDVSQKVVHEGNPLFLPIGNVLFSLGPNSGQLLIGVFHLASQIKVEGAGNDQQQHHDGNRKLAQRFQLLGHARF